MTVSLCASQRNAQRWQRYPSKQTGKIQQLKPAGGDWIWTVMGDSRQLTWKATLRSPYPRLRPRVGPARVGRGDCESAEARTGERPRFGHRQVSGWRLRQNHHGWDWGVTALFSKQIQGNTLTSTSAVVTPRVTGRTNVTQASQQWLDKGR